MTNLQTNYCRVSPVRDARKDFQDAAGVWHYVKVFCTFFCLISSFSCALILTGYQTEFQGMLVAFWLLGALSALLVAPGKFLKFGWTIIRVCAVFGWFLLPFPYDLATVAMSVAVGILAAFAALFAVPAVFTIYTYITDTSGEAVSAKKEILAGAAGFLAAAVLAGGFFLTQGISSLCI